MQVYHGVIIGICAVAAIIGLTFNSVNTKPENPDQPRFVCEGRLPISTCYNQHGKAVGVYGYIKVAYRDSEEYISFK